MLKRELNGVQRGLPWAKVGAVVTGSLYAGLLTTKLGKRIEREHTWFTVMGGVLLTLGWVATEDKKAAERAFAIFVCTGLPIMARAIYLYSQFTESIINREIKRDNQG